MRTVASFALVAFLTGHSTAPVARPVAAEVEVVGTDYAFTMPHELPAGRTAFHFRNSGKNRHELNIVMLKPGVTIDQFIDAAKTNKPQMSMVEGPVGVLFAEPGKTSAFVLSTDLVAGRDYAVQCIIRDSARAPRHLELGMFTTFHVTAATATAQASSARADTIVGVDYAFKYPQAMTAGVHTFVFRNEGKVRHEVFIGLLNKGVTADSVHKIATAGGNPAPLFENSDGLLHSRAGETALGSLEINMVPGRDYMIFCTFQDDANSPPHFTLGMVGNIHVSETPAG